jgi:1,4-dihydroxy-2-naphthoate polyprenyltransferase
LCSGSDANNRQGIFPFTWGSRLIQKGEVSERQTTELAQGLLLFLVPAGLLLAWAYSAPPPRLMARGLGFCPDGRAALTGSDKAVDKFRVT